MSRPLHPIVIIIALTAMSSPGWAKVDKTLSYPYEVIWSTAIRFLRADKDYKVTDKDRDNGFILFIYPGTGSVKKCSASLELVPFFDEKRQKKISVKAQIAHQPSYIEAHLLNQLEQKLREEQGEPPPAKPSDPKVPPQSSKEKSKGKKEKREKR